MSKRKRPRVRSQGLSLWMTPGKVPPTSEASSAPKVQRGSGSHQGSYQEVSLEVAGPGLPHPNSVKAYGLKKTITNIRWVLTTDQIIDNPAHVAVFGSFVLSCIPRYRCPSASSTFTQLRDVLVVSRLWLAQITLLRTLVHRFLRGHVFVSLG